MASADIIPLRPSPTTAGDAELVERVLAGATWAKAELFSRHAPGVTALLTRLLGSTADAEDATQDSFISALTQVDRLREPARFGPWVRQIAVNLAHKKFRRRKLLRFLGLGDDDQDARLDQLADTGVSPEHRAELADIERALRKVSTAERMAWMLRVVEGYELTEVAEACGCSLATVKRRIAAASVEVDRAVGKEVSVD